MNGERSRLGCCSARPDVFTVAAGILPAVEPGIRPGGMGVCFEKSLPFRTSGPGGNMPPSTAAKMAAATDVNRPVNTYARPRAEQLTDGEGGRLDRCRRRPADAHAASHWHTNR